MKLAKHNQQIKWELGSNYANVLNQTITGIIAYDERVYGFWKDRIVVSYSLACNQWLVI